LTEFEKIKVRNFLSYGNNWTTFDFKKGLHRIKGTNGQGKSTIPFDALSFGLFGKPYRKIKINQLINSINKKELEVVLYFRKGEDQYRVERGLNPNYFKIFKNEEIIPVSSSKKGYQEILEQDILSNYNENLFNQITAKSLTKNMSFMTLSKSEKRNIIENLFDIELFSTIGKNIKSKLDMLDVNLQMYKRDIDNIELLIKQEQQNLEQLRNIKKKIDEDSKQKIENITEEITQLNNDNKKYNIALEKIQKNKKIKQNKLEIVTQNKLEIKNLRDKQSDIIASIKLIKSKIELFKSTCGDCPKIKEILQTEDVNALFLKQKTYEEEITTTRETVTTLENEIRKLEEILANEKFILGLFEKNTNRIKILKQDVTMEIGKEIKIDESKYKKHIKNKIELEEMYGTKSNERKHYQILKSLYSDDGIKSFIIKKYLPTINKLLNTYLNRFNTDIIFNFDSDFNEIVLSRFKENFSYFSFSEGQKKRIDLAVLFAFINFALFKNKKGGTNLLIFDEIDSGLDIEGKNRLYEVLKEYKENQNKCILTISQDTAIDPDIFDDVYNVTMEKGFSVINIEKM
jgi:DNA repair exonuclease SbcCD ATPase subunit